MSSTLPPRRDIDFLLHDWLKPERLPDRETIGGLLDLSEKLANEQFLTHYKRADVEEPRLHDPFFRAVQESSQFRIDTELRELRYRREPDSYSCLFPWLRTPWHPVMPR